MPSYLWKLNQGEGAEEHIDGESVPCTSSHPLMKVKDTWGVFPSIKNRFSLHDRLRQCGRRGPPPTCASRCFRCLSTLPFKKIWERVWFQLIRPSGVIYPYSREAAPRPESPRFSENMFFSYPPDLRTNKVGSHCQQGSPKMAATWSCREVKEHFKPWEEHAPVMQKKRSMTWPTCAWKSKQAAVKVILRDK